MLIKSVVIVGAGGGMGNAVTRRLLASGYSVFALDLHAEEQAWEDGVIPISVDVTQENSVWQAAERVSAYTNELYAVLYFAGIYMLESLVEMETAAFDRIMHVNLRGAFLINRAFLPLLKRGSRILLTTSELAPLDPLPFTGIYAISKTALDRYAFSLAMELQLLGISVSVLRAGAVQTEMLGASTRALDAFCQKTTRYVCNAKRFRDIVCRVEARCISPDEIARKVESILKKRHPRFAYAKNRNPLLLLLHCLPTALQLRIIRLILLSR